ALITDSLPEKFLFLWFTEPSYRCYLVSTLGRDLIGCCWSRGYPEESRGKQIPLDEFSHLHATLQGTLVYSQKRSLIISKLCTLHLRDGMPLHLLSVMVTPTTQPVLASGVEDTAHPVPVPGRRDAARPGLVPVPVPGIVDATRPVPVPNIMDAVSPAPVPGLVEAARPVLTARDVTQPALVSCVKSVPVAVPPDPPLTTTAAPPDLPAAPLNPEALPPDPTAALLTIEAAPLDLPAA
ncbi:hypothetical protein P4O66_008824, partial [Electrophorus voltai]